MKLPGSASAASTRDLVRVLTVHLVLTCAALSCRHAPRDVGDAVVQGDGHDRSSESGRGRPAISAERAIRIARRAASAHVRLNDELPPVAVPSGDDYVVTFPHLNPPNVRGPAYEAQVRLDVRSGEVVQVLVGS